MPVYPASAPAATAGESTIEEVQSALTDRYQTTVPQPKHTPPLLLWGSYERCYQPRA
jgi:hypothetical protein